MPQKLPAQSVFDQEKAESEEELQKLKSDREVFENQISNLMEQFLAVDEQIREIEQSLARIDKNISDLELKTKKVRLLTEKLLEQKKVLISEMYILSDDKLFFLKYFISAESFFNLIKGKDETQILAEEQLARISKIDQALELLGQREKLYQNKIADTKSQKEELLGRMNLILADISKNQSGLSAVDLRAAALEQYLLSLGKIDVLNKRDFLAWNSGGGETFTFVGGGTEHGLGMSQHGARGLAKLGKNFQEILTHYYQNTKIKKISTASTIIRVGVVLGGGGGRIEVSGGEAEISGKKIPSFGAVSVGSKEIKIFDSSDREIAKFSNPGDIVLSSQNSNVSFKIAYKLSGYNEYFGKIEVKNIGGSLYTINHLNIEEYLKGVVPAEMPRSWPKEALKAQAVAARSYAVRQLRPQAAFDVDDSTRFQVYLGKNYYFEATNKAIAETQGQVIFYGAEIIPAYYHSTSGGYTENNENIWGGSPRPYLRAVESPWEEDSPWWWWTTRVFSRAELSEILASNDKTNVGQVQKIEILQRGVSGRVLVVKISGSDRQVLVTGSTLRQIINNNLSPSDPPLRSILFGIK